VYTLIVQQVDMIVLLLIQGTSYETGYRYPKGAGAVSILAGKVIAYLPIFLAMFAYFFTIGPMIFNMPVYHNLIEISIFALPYGLAVIFFAVSLSFFAREREAVLLVVLMTSIPFLIISGFMWPSWMMPEWVVWLSKLIPSTAGISGFVAVRQLGADIRDILPQYINLWVLVFGYMITALMAVKWQLKQRNAYEE
ncbi:MAG: ABC transporter permease, partial [Mucispirillum sp.]|nr:ABC transporter permease [Mucispirillum sp.]